MSFCLLSFIGYSQPRAATIDYQKVTRSAVQYDMPYPVKTIENAITDYYSRMGYKSSNSKGFIIFRSVRTPDLGPDSYDLFFYVERKSRRDRDNSIVSLLISKGNDNFIDQTSDEELFNNSLPYLNAFDSVVAAYDLEQQIKNQEDVLSAAEKKSEKLQKEGKDLQSKKEKLERDISDNLKDQNNQIQEISKERQILDALKARRVGQPAGK